MNELIKTLDEVWRFYESDKQGIIDFFSSGYKHFNKKAKRKEAEAMEELLNSKRESIERIKQLLINEDWLPTPENINALPEPVRKYIRDIETNIDPQGMVRENVLIKDTCKALVLKLEEKGPMVDQAFVNTWANEFATATLHDKEMHKKIAYMLKEAGVKVVKK